MVYLRTCTAHRVASTALARPFLARARGLLRHPVELPKLPRAALVCSGDLYAFRKQSQRAASPEEVPAATGMPRWKASAPFFGDGWFEESGPSGALPGRAHPLTFQGSFPRSRYRLGVRTRGSQPRNRGSIPRTGTIPTVTPQSSPSRLRATCGSRPRLTPKWAFSSVWKAKSVRRHQPPQFLESVLDEEDLRRARVASRKTIASCRMRP